MSSQGQLVSKQLLLLLICDVELHSWWVGVVITGCNTGSGVTPTITVIVTVRHTGHGCNNTPLL